MHADVHDEADGARGPEVEVKAELPPEPLFPSFLCLVGHEAIEACLEGDIIALQSDPRCWVEEGELRTVDGPREEEELGIVVEEAGLGRLRRWNL